MKSFRSHKVVQAAPIIGCPADVLPGQKFNVLIEGGEAITLSLRPTDEHGPKCGDYVVVYEDGYTSWSPKGVFEAGYTEIAAEPAVTDEERNRPIIAFLSTLHAARSVLNECDMDPRARALALTKLDEAALWAKDGER